MKEDFEGKKIPAVAPKDVVKKDLNEGSDRYDDVLFEYRANEIKFVERKDQQWIFICKNGLKLSVQLLGEHMFRFRYAPRGDFERDFSYAIDPAFTASSVESVLTEQKKYYELRTPQLICRLYKANLHLQMLNADGEVINEDASGFLAKATLNKGITKVRMEKKCGPQERFFGLGDKAGHLNLRGQRLENWATDAFSYQEGTDPLYRAIPFYYGLHSSKAYGIFMDNSYRSHFDFGYTDKHLVRFSAQGGEMNYYFIYGPDLLEVTRQYAALTGKAALPPLWALGFHQCRWSYYPGTRVRALAAEFRKRKIPCDAIYLDIDYMDGYRCFTVNKKLFPDFRQMIRDLKGAGFETVVMIDPGIRVDEDYEVYQSGLSIDAFCHRLSGELMRGPVWPPECVWPDYSHEEVRRWWGELYREFYLEDGVSGFWNDMNEPAVFKLNSKTFPDEVRHHFDGFQTGHARIHNVYGLLMSRATYEGLRQLQPEKRPLVITRSSYSGGQRFASVWTGDNVASWNHLKIANRQCQRLSISGFSFVGTDIGGFAGLPTGELMVRWLQLGIFHPLYRVHSIGNNTDGAAEVDEEQVKLLEYQRRLDQEPWVFGEPFTSQARAAIELRYRLLAYIYTVFKDHSESGNPVIRPLSFYDQSDPECLAEEMTFLFGDQLLVHPITDPGRIVEKCYLPKGEWYYYWSDKKCQGRQELIITARPDQLPFFVKAGTILPLYPVRQSTAHSRFDTLTLRVYYAEGVHHSRLYEDLGETYEYREESYSNKSITLKASTSGLELKINKNGHYLPSYRKVRMELVGLPFVPEACIVDGKALDLERSVSAGPPVYRVLCGHEIHTMEVH